LPQSKASGTSDATQRVLFVRLPTESDVASSESFEFATLQLSPQGDAAAFATSVMPVAEDQLIGQETSRSHPFYLSMRLDAGGLSADKIERVRIFLSKEFLFLCVTLFCKIKLLARKDAMYPLTAADLSSIWQARMHLTSIEEALPKVFTFRDDQYIFSHKNCTDSLTTAFSFRCYCRSSSPCPATMFRHR
jgi:hypothetical protein